MTTKTFEVTIKATVTIKEVTSPSPVDPIDPGPIDPIDPDPIDPGPVSKRFYGVNTFPWVPVSKLVPFDSARIYVGSHWIWRPDGIFTQPMYQAETKTTSGIDQLLENMDKIGIEPLLCIHQTPEWLLSTGNAAGTNSNDLPPTTDNKNRAVPASYTKYAKFLWQIAARYGSRMYPESDLNVSPTMRWNGDGPQVAKSGLKLLKYFEPWNECDKWWKVQASKDTEYFTPEEMAAFMSACYDGHEGSIFGAGIKNADPDMIVVMPGLTGCDKNYILRMDAWFDKNRKDKDWPCDIFNVHFYPNIGDKADRYPPTWVESGACTPDVSKATSQLIWVRDFCRDTLAMPLWLTEFGCDSKGPSQMAHIKGEEGQAHNIASSFAFYKNMGIKRAFMFTAVDEQNSANGGLWQNCGLYTNEATGYKPKPVYNLMKKEIEFNNQ